MRYLGIDYGRKRIGIAVSDPEGRIAFPKKIIFNRGTEYVINALKAILEEDRVSRVVVGLPLMLDGKESEETREVRGFVQDLKKEIAIPIEFENEMLTTHIVMEEGMQKEHTDEAAAALILQSYLDKAMRNYK